MIYNKKCKKIVSAAFVLCFAWAFLMSPSLAKAQTGFFQPFGGKITAFTPCTCSEAEWLYLVPLHPISIAGGPMAYMPGVSFLHDWYAPIPGMNLLGDYSPIPACYIVAGPTCVPLFTFGLINKTGTSNPAGI